MGNWQNRVYPGGFWTKSGTFFFATGRAYARMQNASKTRSGAWTHYALCARSTPNRFFGVRPLKTAPMTAPKKCSPRTTRFCSGTHRVYPALCFDFINHPILFILHPILFIPHPILFNFARPAETRKRTSPLNPARKIFHTTGKLPTVTTVMQPQQHC